MMSQHLESCIYNSDTLTFKKGKLLSNSLCEMLTKLINIKHIHIGRLIERIHPCSFYEIGVAKRYRRLQKYFGPNVPEK